MLMTVPKLAAACVSQSIFHYGLEMLGGKLKIFHSSFYKM
jgi:hypothetical protein